jgi:hypothetical protein
MTARDRIVELFTRARPAYPPEEVLRLLSISDGQLANAIADGRVELETNDQGATVIPWEEVAHLALEEWTPRMIAAVVREETPDAIPYLNQPWFIRVSLPRYLIRLLAHLAQQESITRRVSRNASDIIERILHEYANTVDLRAIEAVIPGFQQALSYPYFMPHEGGVHLRCMYCNVSTTKGALAVCNECAARHEPDEYRGEYGLPELDN